MLLRMRFAYMCDESDKPSWHPLAHNAPTDSLQMLNGRRPLANDTQVQ